MKIVTAGIDYVSAPIEIREKLSFVSKETAVLNQKIRKEKGVRGCVILSTCNRTEIYISCDEKVFIDAEKLIIKHAEADPVLFSERFKRYEGIDAVTYLLEVTCGLRSQIFGDEQIVGQVNRALEISRECGCADSVLETLFRIAITAGKYVRTNVKVLNTHASAAYRAVDLLHGIYGSFQNRKGLVIGNGNVGRLAARLLVENGCNVFITLRSYRHGKTIVPKGCATVEYSKRMSVADGCDFILSATASAHYTIKAEDIRKIEKKPKVIIDIALPRDIDPKVFEFEEIDCYNIDSLGVDNSANEDEVREIYKIIDKYKNDFIIWENYKRALPLIEDIKRVAALRLIECEEFYKYKNISELEEILVLASYKITDMIFGGLKKNVGVDMIMECRDKIKERARIKVNYEDICYRDRPGGRK